MTHSSPMTSDAAVGAAPVAPPESRPVNPWLKRLFWLNLVVEIGIVVTGGLVRLTGSGLGCPTWPQCVPGSYTPVPEQEQSWHKYIEFGNRTLTGVVGIVAIALCLGIFFWARTRRRLLLPAGCVVLGIVLQAVVGGITVHMDLNPFIVALHFMLSMLLVTASAWLVWRGREGDGPKRPLVPTPIAVVAKIAAVLAFVVLVLGTMVTGSGPHSGDADEPARTGWDARSVAWLHADAVMLFCGLVVAVLLSLFVLRSPATTRRTWIGLLVITLLQGVLGYVQYFTGVPWVPVLFHMLGACLLVTWMTWALCCLRERP
ncbi:heme A synthase [Dermacoccus sp. SAI-028]|uniref:COX15/CtaA family protein n=1 Tax=Dermacoccus sp. SAI-028 TaxID=2768432 RepID=UPI001F403821|nr:COX15/CtaA family protein [Dermacoccus sp. SAI-028]